MKHKIEVAARTLQVSFDLFKRMGADARRGLLGKNVC